ncbi:uncharacterized protein [Panulirus ornatus]|uniref:uncharacterized protein isoform X1 n=1 Tax=Panulirus ornatus TaxID=150431 RepID=UPI003A8406ED
MLVQRFLAWAIILLQLRQGCCVCYFPGELHGVWETQVTTGRGGRSSRPPTIHYQNITIHSDLIVQWGFCHTRIDNDIILSDRTGSSECFRCVRVDMVSPSLVQVWTTGLETCYTTEDAALRTCPAPADRASRRASQIMLYRIKSSWDEREVEGCPLIGRYTFTYRRGSNGVTAASCDQPTSEFSNCPYGFGFNVIYRDCSFPTPERRGLQCLGSWVGEDQNNYLAVWESSVNDANDNLPRYKCGMFREEAGTGRILLALSEDSTCTNGLSSPADGYETYVMTSVPSPPLPPDVSASTCTFPRTLLGHWHHTFVADNTIIFKDYLHYMTYSASCVRDMDDGERYIVYTRTHCGDWKYNCLWLKRRSANVLEFMLGLYPRETFDLSLCDADKFGDMTSWITQGKSLLEEPTTCPIVGTYAGQLPDASGICAQLYSDCDSPEIMYYTVSACRNASTVYEREDLPGPTSEAGPWLPAEQKVSTGAVLTIVEDQDWRRQRQVKSDDFPVDNSRTSTFSWRLGNVSTIVDDRGARKRRHASGGQFRVANARTTTISWLWGTTPSPYTTSSTASTTTSTTTTRPSTTVDSGWSSLPVSRPPGPYAGPSSERNYNRHDPYIETPRRQEPPRRDGYNPIGFWPSSQTQRNNQPADVTPATPVVGRGPVRHYAPTEDTPAPPAVGRGPIRHYPPAEDTPAPPVVGRGSVRLRSNTTSDSGESGVPGRATWVPGAPPGFQPLTSTQQPVVSDTLPRESLEDNPHPAVVPSPPRNTDYNYYNPAGGTNRQPLKQSGHSQRPVKQGTQGREYSEYAWDNRHKYPIGHWLTARPREKASDINAEPDLRDNGALGGPSGESERSMTDNRDVHFGGGSSWVSWPGNGGVQGEDNPFTRSSAPPTLIEPKNVTTSFPSGWKPSLGPSSLPPFTVVTFRDESHHNRRPSNGHATDDDQQVRDSSFSLLQNNKTVNRQPNGRGFWSSATDTTRNRTSWDSSWNSDGKRPVSQHSYTPTTRQPAVFTDRTINRPSDTLGFHPIDPDRQNVLKSNINGIAQVSTWARDQGIVEVHDIPLSSERQAGMSPGRATGSRWVSEITDTSSYHSGDPREFHGQSSIGEPQRRPGAVPASASAWGVAVKPRRVEMPILPSEREYQCLGQWEEEGRVYALTYRRDIHTYECFVGVIKTDGVVFIKEAGARCSRGVQPVILGMKLHRKASCTPKSTPTRASQSSQRNRTRPPATSPPWLHTTKPWKPITAVESQALVTCKVGDTCAGLDDKHSASLSTLSRLTERTKKGRHALGDVNNYNAGDSSQSHISTIQKNYMMTRLLNSINDEAKEQKIPSSKDSLDHGKLHYPLLKHEFQIPLTHSKREASHRAPQRVRRDADEEQEVMIDTDTSESMIITVRGYVRRARENSMMNRALGNGQSYEARKVSISQGTHADPGHKRETYAPHQCDNCSVQASAPQNSREERDIPVKIYHEVDHSHGHNTTSALAKSTFLVLPVTDVPPPVPGVTMLIVHDSTTHAHDPDHMPPGSGNTHHNGTNNGIGNTHHNGADHGTGNIHHNGTDHGTGNTQHNGGDHGTGNIHHNGAGHGTGNIHHNGTDHGTGNTQHNGTDHGTGNTHHNGADHGTGNTHHNGTDHGTGNTQHNGADHGTGNTQHNGTDHGTGNIHHNGADHETGNTHYNGTDYGIGNAHRSGADHGTGNTQHSGADHGTGNTQYNGGDHGTGNTQHNGADHGTGNIYHNGTDHGTGHIHHNGADHGTGNTHHNGADHGTGHIHHNGADHGTGNTHHNGADHGTGNTHHNGADHGTGHIHHNGADHGTGNTHHNGADHGTGNTHHNGADHGTGNTHHNGADHGTGNTHHNGANYGTRNTHHNGGDHETGNIHHNGADHGTRNTHHNGGDHETGNIHHNIADHGTGSIHHNSADLGTENTHHSGNDHGVSDRHSYDIGGDHGPSSTHEIPADRRGRDGTNYHTDNDRNIVGSRVNKSNPHSDADYEVQAGDVNNNGTDHEVQALNDHHHSTDHDETDNTQLQDKPLHKLSHINNTGDEDNLNDYSEDRFNKGESASVKDQTINSGDELYQNFNSSIKSSEKAGENIPKTTSTHIREINGSLSGSTSVLGYTGDFLSTESSTKNHEISKPKIYFLPRTTYLVDKEAMVTHSYNLEIDSENQTHKLTSNQTGTQWSHLTGVHENVTNKDIMMSENDHTDIVLRSEDTSSYEKNKINMSNITLNCISIIDNNNLNMTENVTKFNSFTNCSENWTIQHDSIVETPTSWTTEDNSDIPKIPISLIEYPTHPHTTVKPFIVTLPALVWQPLGEPGRPSHRGSGCEGLLVTSNLLLLSTLALNLLT